MRFLKKLRVQGFLLCALFSGVIFTVSAGKDLRFSDAWKFFCGYPTGAEARLYNDASWSTVYLPRPDSVILNYKDELFYLGACWYRKSFTPDLSLQGKKIYLEFEAAMQTAQVWVNGTSKITHVGGYTPFVIDITNDVQFGATNVIAARLDNTPSTSFPPGHVAPDFLYFGGLYRDVRLLSMDSLHITNALYANIAGGGGVFVTYPAVSTSSATVQVKTHVLNEYTATKSCIVTTVIVDSNGATVATNSTAAQNITAGASNTFTQTFSVTNPHLWHPNTPYCYRLRSQVYSGTTLTDTCSTTIGIRSIAFSKANGFQINGARYYFRGANRHQYYPYIGNAVPYSGQYRDALRMKEYGFNFVRMSHYVQAKGFVDACDKLGVLSMACLPGWQYFNNNATFINNSIIALRDMIRYYRNHPSVILFESMHNETSPTTAYLNSAQTAANEEFAGSTQMYTCGEEGNNILDVYISSSQHGVRSYNGSRACQISEYGDWDIGPCVWANPITGCADRVSRSDGEAALLRQAYNHDTSLSANRALSWLTGDALWSAYDYQTWAYFPLTTSGALDIFRIPKFSAHFFRSQRSPADTLVPGVKGGPMVFIASYWTTTSARPVTVYSNCEQVRLSLNGTTIATQSPITGSRVEHPRFSFTIASFQAGTLRAEGLIGGVVRAIHEVKTPVTAARVVVTIDTANLAFAADGSDIAIVYASIVDSNGTVMPAAGNSVNFTIVSGPGDYIGYNPQTAEAGIASILLRSRATAGPIIVNAAASGLTSGRDTVTSVAPPATGIIGQFRKAVYAPVGTWAIRQKGKMLFIQVPPAAAGSNPPAAFSLYNAQGRQVGRWNMTESSMTVNMKDLPHGIYIGQISRSADRYIQKLAW